MESPEPPTKSAPGCASLALLFAVAFVAFDAVLFYGWQLRLVPRGSAASAGLAPRLGVSLAVLAAACAAGVVLYRRLPRDKR